MTTWNKATEYNVYHEVQVLRSNETTEEARDESTKRILSLMTPAHWEVLEQLLNSPTWDGNIISKVHRDDLINVELATRVCYKFQQGYTAATYPANTLWQAANRKRPAA